MKVDQTTRNNGKQLQIYYENVGFLGMGGVTQNLKYKIISKAGPSFNSNSEHKNTRGYVELILSENFEFDGVILVA